MAETELWPINHETWLIYGHVGNIMLPAIWQVMPPLDIGGVIAALEYLGLSPADQVHKKDLLDDLMAIHSVRQEIAKREHDKELEAKKRKAKDKT